MILYNDNAVTFSLLQRKNNVCESFKATVRTIINIECISDILLRGKKKDET